RQSEQVFAFQNLIRMAVENLQDLDVGMLVVNHHVDLHHLKREDRRVGFVLDRDGDKRAGLGCRARRGQANRNHNQADGDQTGGRDETNRPLVRLTFTAETQRTRRSRRERRRRVEGRVKRRSFPLSPRFLRVLCASAVNHTSCTLSNYHVIHLAPPEFLKPEGASRVSVSKRELNKWRREAERLRNRL